LDRTSKILAKTELLNTADIRQKYKFQNTIGVGHYGKVRQASRILDGKLFAVKTIPLSQLHNSEHEL
jgi:serine/threonine protein kinase